MTVTTVVGAYAAMPQEVADQEKFYDALEATGWVDGIEIPYRDALDADPARLARRMVGRFPHSVVTAIPGTMGHVGSDPDFGLASPEEEGRQRALTWSRGLLDAVRELHDAAGSRVVRRVEVHSAPSRRADVDAFRTSLGELAEPFAAEGLEIVVEHCDAVGGVGPGEKEFLSLDDEITAVTGTPARVTINWGRSVVESHDTDRPTRQVARLAAAGQLGGVMFSGAGPEATQYGPVWGDAHLPLVIDEPTSLLTPELVAAVMAAAHGTQTYQGIKIQTPATATVAQRIGMLEHIHRAMVDA